MNSQICHTHTGHHFDILWANKPHNGIFPKFFQNVWTKPFFLRRHPIHFDWFTLFFNWKRVHARREESDRLSGDFQAFNAANPRAANTTNCCWMGSVYPAAQHRFYQMKTKPSKTTGRATSPLLFSIQPLLLGCTPRGLVAQEVMHSQMWAALWSNADV